MWRPKHSKGRWSAISCDRRGSGQGLAATRHGEDHLVQAFDSCLVFFKALARICLSAFRLLCTKPWHHGAKHRARTIGTFSLGAHTKVLYCRPPPLYDPIDPCRTASSHKRSHHALIRIISSLISTSFLLMLKFGSAQSAQSGEEASLGRAWRVPYR